MLNSVCYPVINISQARCHFFIEHGTLSIISMISIICMVYFLHLARIPETEQYRNDIGNERGRMCAVCVTTPGREHGQPCVAHLCRQIVIVKYQIAFLRSTLDKLVEPHKGEKNNG